MKQKLILIGAGGYAKSVLDSIDYNQYDFCGFIDSFKLIGDNHLGYPIMANSIQELENYKNYVYFISIGDNIHRTEKFVKLQQLGCEIINVIDKTAIVSKNAKIGKGIFVGKMAIVNRGAEIKDNVVVNTKALVEHGCCISNHCNISTNSTLNGDVKVDEYAFIGSSSVVNGQLSVGRHSVVGAGAVVVRSVEAFTVVAGIPARILKYLNKR